jgi:hypothetical protein
VRRSWTGGGRAAALAVLAAAALAVSAQPAAAGPGEGAVLGVDTTLAGAGGSAGAEKPAPVDPHRARTGAGPRALGEGKHTVPNDLLKERLAEDEDEGEDAPSASALCQKYVPPTVPNPYRNPSPNVDVINGDTIVPVGSQAGCSAAQNETTIAVNNTNPRNLVAGANDYRTFNTREQRNDGAGWAYTTFDGGRTWKNVLPPHLTFATGAPAPLSYMDAAGDPAITFGPGNTVYYANLVFSRAAAPAGQQVATGLTVSTSHDGGLTWGEPSILQLDGVKPDGTPTPSYIFNDKEWIAADPHSGTVYVTWTRFTYDTSGRYLESPIYMRKSKDFGRTWSAATRVAPSLDGFKGGITPFNQGSNPQVGNDGTLYVAYQASVCAAADCGAADDHDAVVVATSRDGGTTFKNEEVATDYDFPDTLTKENFRLNSYPLTAYDRFTGQLWITWADDRNGTYSDRTSVKTNGDVFVVGSKLGGRGWTKVTKVGSGTDEFFPGVAAVGGRVAVSYYTRKYDPNGIGLDYAYSVGWGAGIDGSAVRRITTETANPQIQFVSVAPDGSEIQGVFIGDYSQVAMGWDFHIHPCWTDFRGKPGVTKPNQDVYTQSIPVL